MADLLSNLGITPGEPGTHLAAAGKPPGAWPAGDDRPRPPAAYPGRRADNVSIGSWGATPRAVLADAGVDIDTYDQVLLNGVAVPLDAPLPPRHMETSAPTYDRGFAWDAVRSEPLQLRVTHAIPVMVHKGGLPYTIDTTAQTVGEALRQSEVILYLGDHVQPSLGSRVTANMDVYIERSVPVTLQVDGHKVKITRAQAQTVGDALTDSGVVLAGLDRVEPPLATLLYNNIQIAVTRLSRRCGSRRGDCPLRNRLFCRPHSAHRHAGGGRRRGQRHHTHTLPGAL